MAEMEKALEAKKLELSTRTPAFQKLEVLFEEKSKSYDVMKKGIVSKFMIFSFTTKQTWRLLLLYVLAYTCIPISEICTGMNKM